MPDPSQPGGATEAASNRSRQVRQALDKYLVCRAQGENISTDELLSTHGSLQVELAAELQKLAIIDRARAVAVGDE